MWCRIIYWYVSLFFLLPPRLLFLLFLLFLLLLLFILSSSLLLLAAYKAGVKMECEQVDISTHKTASGADFYAINPKGNHM
jgi:hypothetical protein